MTSIALHPTPEWRTVAREQIRAVALASRRPAEMTLAGIIIIGATIIAYGIYFGPQFGAGVSYGPEFGLPTVIAALLLLAPAWQGEDWLRRTYHWSMPVGRATHALTKAFAGWVCLMIGVAIYLITVALVLWLLNAATHSHAAHAVPAWEWGMPFTAATVVYGLISAPIVGSRHPGRWVLGVVITYVLAFDAAIKFELPTLGHVLEGTLSGYAGLGPATIGMLTVASPLDSHVILPSAERWLVSAGLWTAIATAAVVVAAYYRGKE